MGFVLGITRAHTLVHFHLFHDTTRYLDVLHHQNGQTTRHILRSVQRRDQQRRGGVQQKKARLKLPQQHDGGGGGYCSSNGGSNRRSSSGGDINKTQTEAGRGVLQSALLHTELLLEHLHTTSLPATVRKQESVVISRTLTYRKDIQVRNQKR